MIFVLRLRYVTLPDGFQRSLCIRMGATEYNNKYSPPKEAGDLLVG